MTSRRKTTLLLAHHGEPLFGVFQVVADASGRQRVGEAGHLVEDPTLGHHDEEDGHHREAGEGADDVDGVLGRGVVSPPGDGAGQSVRLGDVLAPADQREAGPHGSHQPEGAARHLDVRALQPHAWEKNMELHVVCNACLKCIGAESRKIVRHLKVMKRVEAAFVSCTYIPVCA